MLKVELHAHTDHDPLDHIAHSTRELIDRAAGLGFQALAITLHNRYFDPAGDAAYACARGVLLMAGIERSIHHRHVLLVNFPPRCAEVRDFDDIAELRREWPDGLVIAPHPFYPIASALREQLVRHPHLVDAVEVNSMHTRLVDFNRRAIRWARANGKTLVGNTDLHLLDQMGTTYTMVDAEPDADAICAAIREGRAVVRSVPLSTARAGWIYARMVTLGLAGRIGRVFGRQA